MAYIYCAHGCCRCLSTWQSICQTGYGHVLTIQICMDYPDLYGLFDLYGHVLTIQICILLSRLCSSMQLRKELLATTWTQAIVQLMM